MSEKTYSRAINEALHQVMERYPDVMQIGVGVNTPFYVGQTMNGLLARFGKRRMMDTPVSENAVAGMALGAALSGLRPILTFPRMDFMYYAMDQLFNHVSAMTYTLGHSYRVPLTVRAIINRGGEQGAQHSQALQAVFQHVPGFRVVMPANARDAKGMMIAAVESGEPVVYIEDRWLYEQSTEVPDEYHAEPLEGARVVKPGTDVTVVASSFGVNVCLEAARLLGAKALEAEVIDLRSIKPLDIGTLRRSVGKTGRVVVLDGSWKTGGVAAEVAARLAEECFAQLKTGVRRIALPDHHAPSSRPLEKQYYWDPKRVAQALEKAIGRA